MIARRLVVAVAAMVGIVIAVACRQVAGIGPRDEAPSCSGATYVDATCGECTELHCCEALTSCRADAACASTYACLARCAPTDEKCRSACRDLQPAGLTSAMAAVMACQATTCSAECRFACGGYVASSAACAGCFGTQCCDAARACNESAACLERRFCRMKCRDEDCKTACRIAHPAGLTEDSALIDCQSDLCPAECGAWFCAAFAPPPLLKPTTITITLQFEDDSASRPHTKYPGLEVARCTGATTTCKSSSTWVTTDVEGRASFDVPLDGERFIGFFEMRDPAGLLVDMVVIPWPPIGESTAIEVRAITKEQQFNYAGALGTEVRHDRGTVLVHARDCLGNDAPLRYEWSGPVDADTREFYVVNGDVYRASSTDTGRAYGGFFNVEPGASTIRGTAATTPPLDVFPKTFTVLADTLMYIDYALAR